MSFQDKASQKRELVQQKEKELNQIEKAQQAQRKKLSSLGNTKDKLRVCASRASLPCAYQR